MDIQNFFILIKYIKVKKKEDFGKMTKAPYSRLSVLVTAKVIQTHMNSQGPTETRDNISI